MKRAGKEIALKKMMIAIFIGFLCGLFAIIFKLILFNGIAIVLNKSRGYIIYLVPIVGGVLVGIIRKYLLNENNQQFGIAEVKKEMKEITRLIMGPRDVAIKIFGAFVTLISGLSAGTMGPIFHMGGAIGANTAYALHEDDEGIRLFIGCGVAACIAGIFNEPLFATIFVLEVIMEGYLLEDFIYIIGSVVTAKIVNKLLFISPVTLKFSEDIGISGPREYVLFIILGIFMGLVSKLYLVSIKRFSRLGKVSGGRYVLMGLLVGIMTAAVEYFTPMMYDYFNFISVKKFEFLLWIIPIIIIIKMLLTSITLGAGGFGGSFAPGLIIGVYSGILFWKVASLLLVGWGLKENTYVLVAIAGIIGGFFDAPFAGSLFVLELTGDYNLILPALMTSVISNFNVKLLEK